MKKTLTSALVLTFAVVLSFALATGPAAAKDCSNPKNCTILEVLENTDGAQALAAATQFVDSEGTCDVNFAELLGDKKEQIILLAPTNEGFEEFLNLPPGTLGGLSVNNIVGIFKGLSVDPNSLCDDLLKHVAVLEKGKAKKKGSEDALLKNGSITVLGSDYPVSIGGATGVWIGYANAITKRDVFTKNGVIHYLDKVIVEPPPPPPPDETGGPEGFDICTRGTECLPLSEEAENCNQFMTDCIASAANQNDIEECVGAAFLFCIEIEFEPEPF